MVKVSKAGYADTAAMHTHRPRPLRSAMPVSRRCDAVGARATALRTRHRRSRTAPTAWHWLALLAMLLLALAPAISRLQAGAHVDTAHDSMVAAASGHAAGHAAPDDHPHEGAQEHAGAEGHCGYCPLASHLTLLSTVPVVVPPTAWVAAPAVRFRSARRIAAANLRGLGGQGPPAHPIAA
ncbi:DUF2946 family protein [Luteimonas sp. S4-F44]|uniref:DUF2946 family protein n=1 Tax=Luteimonas sp. S4-F44 TaxID=2925842 RepID=UPI001F52F812|nr:DUF2946 family protein [Luteimonas sp. S4-F44]UNK44200.1 DUF2946 family protein [Luteimonas sp. S4-F44]